MGLEFNLSKPCRLGRTFLINPRDTLLMILMSRKSKYIAQVGRFLGPPERTYLKESPVPVIRFYWSFLAWVGLNMFFRKHVYP